MHHAALGRESCNARFLSLFLGDAANPLNKQESGTSRFQSADGLFYDTKTGTAVQHSIDLPEKLKPTPLEQKRILHPPRIENEECSCVAAVQGC